MLHRLFSNATPAHAHCDLYCGVYDPAQARIEAESIKNTQLAEELALPPVKIHCSVLAEDAIKAAVRDYKQKKGLL